MAVLFSPSSREGILTESLKTRIFSLLSWFMLIPPQIPEQIILLRSLFNVHNTKDDIHVLMEIAG